MAKEDLLEFEGMVLELLPDARFRVRLDALEDVTMFWEFEIVERGEAEATVIVKFSGKDAALFHTLAWGTNVRALEPLDLCESVVQRAREALAHYGITD